MRWFLVCAFAVALILGATTLEIARTQGQSMSPSLSDGEAVLVVKPVVLRWLGRSFQRGDVIVVDVWDQRYVKRVAALGHQHIAMRNGEVVATASLIQRSQDREARRDRPVSQGGHCDVGEPPGSWHWSFVPAESTSGRYEPTSCNWGPIRVPESQFFVLGDHVARSNDSRSFGFVEHDMIEGLVIWNISRWTIVGEGEYEAVR